MRILELLAFLRDLLSSELRAIVDALPLALNDLRAALQTTVDQCVAFLFTSDITPRGPRFHKRKRLSRMKGSRNLLRNARKNGTMSHTSMTDIQDNIASPEKKRARYQESPSRADGASAHDNMECVSRLRVAEDDDKCGVQSQAVAKAINEHLEAIPVPGDSVACAEENTFINVGDNSIVSLETTALLPADEELLDNPEEPPSSLLSDWNEAIPRVAGVAQQLPSVWSTEMMTNMYAALDDGSETTSDAFSTRDTESVASDVPRSISSTLAEMENHQDVSGAVIPMAVLEVDQVQELSKTIANIDIVGKESGNTAKTVQTKEAASGVVGLNVVSPPSSKASSTSSSRNLKMFTTGVSYRQLTEELSPSAQNTDASTTFYRAALQKLKEEREMRARARAEAETLSEELVHPYSSSSRVGLSPLRPMQVTPVKPNHDLHCVRKLKIEDLRQRMTTFAIKIGQPLSESCNDTPTREAYAV